MAEAPYASFKINGGELSLSVPGLGPAADPPQECLSGDLKRFKENTWPFAQAQWPPHQVPPPYERGSFFFLIE